MFDREIQTRDILTSRSIQMVTLPLATGIIIYDSLGRWALGNVAGIGVQARVLVVLLATLAIGQMAKWGLALGFIVSGIILGDYSGGVTVGFAAFLGAIVCSSLWYPYDRSKNRVRWVLQYGAVAVITTFAFAATQAWLGDLFGAATFAVIVIQTVQMNFLIAAVGFPIVWLGLYAASFLDWEFTCQTSSRLGRLIVSTIVVIWALGGYIGSYLFQAISTVPADTLESRFPSVVETLIIISGHQGSRVIALFGFSMLILLYAATRTY